MSCYFSKELAKYDKKYQEEYREKNREKLLAKQREYGKEHYKKNKETVDQKHRDYYKKNREKRIAHNNKRYAEMKQEFFLTYKKGKSCTSCGYNEHPEILQFHHKNKREKEFTIGNISATNRKDKALIKKEIEKCILLCPNCHFLLHFKRIKEKMSDG